MERRWLIWLLGVSGLASFEHPLVWAQPDLRAKKEEHGLARGMFMAIRDSFLHPPSERLKELPEGEEHDTRERRDQWFPFDRVERVEVDEGRIITSSKDTAASGDDWKELVQRKKEQLQSNRYTQVLPGVPAIVALSLAHYLLLEDVKIGELGGTDWKTTGEYYEKLKVPEQDYGEVYQLLAQDANFLLLPTITLCDTTKDDRIVVGDHTLRYSLPEVESPDRFLEIFGLQCFDEQDELSEQQRDFLVSVVRTTLFGYGAEIDPPLLSDNEAFGKNLNFKNSPPVERPEDLLEEDVVGEILEVLLSRTWLLHCIQRRLHEIIVSGGKDIVDNPNDVCRAQLLSLTNRQSIIKSLKWNFPAPQDKSKRPKTLGGITESESARRTHDEGPSLSGGYHPNRPALGGGVGEGGRPAKRPMVGDSDDTDGPPETKRPRLDTEPRSAAQWTPVDYIGLRRRELSACRV